MCWSGTNSVISTSASIRRPPGPATTWRYVVPTPCPPVRVISITPLRHRLSFSALAKKAKTSPTGRAMVIVFDSSGIAFSLCDGDVELLQPFRPTRSIRRGVMPGREAIVGDDHLGPLVAQVIELDGDQGLVVRGSRACIPAPCVDEQRRRIDFSVGAGHRHLGGAAWGQHHEPVGATGAKVDLGRRTAEPARSPPACQLRRLRPAAKHSFP